MPDLNKKQRLRLLERYGHTCPYCLRELQLDNLSIDHVIPRATYISKKRREQLPSALRLKEWLHNKELTGAERIPCCKECNHTRRIQSLISFLKSEYITNHVPHTKTP